MVEGRRVPPDPPDAVLEAHLVDARNAARVRIEEGVLSRSLVPSHQPASVWRAGDATLTLDEKMAVLDPLEAIGAANGRRTTHQLVSLRRPADLHVPPTREHVELL